jgi:hypothetical protein
MSQTDGILLESTRKESGHPGRERSFAGVLSFYK